MAPLKVPKTLLDISYAAVVNLVLDKCVDIDAKYSIDEQKWEDACDNLKGFLLLEIPSSLWDSMSDAVYTLADRKGCILNDCSVLYATLACRHTKKLTIECFCGSESSKEFYNCFDMQMITPTEANKVYRNLWIKLFAQLDNLESFNNNNNTSMEIASVSQNTQFIDLLKHCQKLRHLRLMNPANSREAVSRALETFPQLEKINCLHMADVISGWQHSDRLSLRYVKEQGPCWPMHIQATLALCPYLRSLQFHPVTIETSEEIFTALADSSVRLDELNIEKFFYGEQMDRFLVAKGDTITKLSVRITISSVDLYRPISVVGNCCRNLATFKVYHYNDEFDWQSPRVPELELFKKLTVLKSYGASAIPRLCLASSTRVTSFDFSSSRDEMSDDDIVAMLNPAWVTRITRLDLYKIRTEKLLRHIYENCPMVTSVATVCIKQGADESSSLHNYLKHIRKEIKDNNLELVIDTVYL